MGLAEIETFLRVAEAGSLAKAARQLGLPTSTVSRRVARLEAELGEALLLRGARSLALTDAGNAIVTRCAGPLRDIDEAARAVRDHDDEPEGELRITAPSDLASTAPFVALIQGFRAAWPRVRVRLELGDRVVDLVAERVDVAFRAHLGRLPDSSTLVARRVADLEGGVYASPAWVAAHGEPRTPADLRQLPCLAHSRAGTSWTLTGPETVEVRVFPVIVANDLNFLRQAMEAGAGVGLFPSLFAGPGLVRLLPEWRTPAGGLSLLWPKGSYAPRVRRFVEHASRALAHCPEHPRRTG